jgi:hypothetical protein
VAGAFPGLPGPFLAHISADAFKVFHAGAIALIALVDNGPDGIQAEVRFLRDGAQRLAAPVQFEDSLTLRVAGGQGSGESGEKFMLR